MHSEHFLTHNASSWFTCNPNMYFSFKEHYTTDTMTSIQDHNPQEALKREAVGLVVVHWKAYRLVLRSHANRNTLRLILDSCFILCHEWTVLHLPCWFPFLSGLSKATLNSVIHPHATRECLFPTEKGRLTMQESLQYIHQYQKNITY